jgi:hypothetical protein
MKAFNKAKRHTAEIKLIDFSKKTAKLIQPNSSPIFIYEEILENLTILEDTGVTLDGKSVYIGDLVTDSATSYVVKKVPGGYFPFIEPVKKNFKRVNK